jgi:L,D-peptidoglycan transpeptidase YkuD (ErfK/YbiS/YcfS/YnhG family)
VRAISFYLLMAVSIMGADTMQMSSSLSKALTESRQLILVTTGGWDAVDGEMKVYERNSVNNQWRAVGEKIPVVVGRNGMAWGKGLHGDVLGEGGEGGEGPVKQEGDGRSPAGVFSLGSAFGYAPPEQAGEVKLPYVQSVETLECVDDPQSAHYNRIVDRARVENPDWKSSERMRRDDDQYCWGVVVDHNANGAPGCGSCIFMHVWEAQGKGTAGCTAMKLSSMERLRRRLDATKRPILVQLPRAEFERLREAWGLFGPLGASLGLTMRDLRT